jgi:O-antigen biosynthesis protein
VTANGTTDPFRHSYFERFRPNILEKNTVARVVILIGSLDISGGTYVILEHAAGLQREGFSVELAPMLPVADSHLTWHPALSTLPIVSLEEARQRNYDIAIATWWASVFELPRMKAPRWLYFVQSAESRFSGHATDDSRALAELTFTFDIPMITIARWLQVYLAERYGRPAYLVRNGIRKDWFSPFGPAVEPRRADGVRVLVEGPLGVPMKLVSESVQAAQAGGADEIWLLTSTRDVNAVAGVSRVFSAVPNHEVPAVLRSCDVLLKISAVEGMFGPPLEMFHCGGTAITNDVTGSEEYLVDGVNSRVVPTGDYVAVALALRQLRSDPALLSSLKRGALDTAIAWPGWDRSTAEFAWFVKALLRTDPRPIDRVALAIAGARQLDHL